MTTAAASAQKMVNATTSGTAGASRAAMLGFWPDMSGREEEARRQNSGEELASPATRRAEMAWRQARFKYTLFRVVYLTQGTLL